MAHGHEDWGINPSASAIVSTDTNELAVRLGSNYRISRTGHVYYDTSFIEDLSQWRYTKSSNGLTAYLNRLQGVFANGCLGIFNSIAADRNITLVKRLPRPNSPKWGLETIIWFHTNNALVRATLTLNDGVNDSIFGVEINSNDDQIKLLDSDGIYDNVSALTITPISTSDAWIYTKIIVDSGANSYSKLIVNSTEITTIAQTPDINANVDIPKAEITLFADNTGATTFRLFIGTCILTIDEP